jgi:glycosyltransferase involved in cell wall biosynthesis
MLGSDRTEGKGKWYPTRPIVRSLNLNLFMRQLFFLLPGTTGKYICGGLFAELKAAELARQVCPIQIVTYRQREADKLFLDDILAGKVADLDLAQVIFVMSWGFDVAGLAERLRHYHLIYHAHSAGYGFRLPAHIPIITVSRNTMGYWGQIAPHALIYYLPNQISDEFYNYHLDRDIDVLVQARKSSTYLMTQLIPQLKEKCNVYVVDGFVDDLVTLFNRAKIYLYDSAEYWAQQGVTEGFGLQPLEAMATGCQVFSSVNHGLSDYLDPGFNCQKIAAYSPEFDTQRILKSVAQWQAYNLPIEILAEYRKANIIDRWRVILPLLNDYFDQKAALRTTIPELTPTRIMRLNAQRFLGKVRKKLELPHQPPS